MSLWMLMERCDAQGHGILGDDASWFLLSRGARFGCPLFLRSARWWRSFSFFSFQDSFSGRQSIHFRIESFDLVRHVVAILFRLSCLELTHELSDPGSLLSQVFVNRFQHAALFALFMALRAGCGLFSVFTP